MTKRKIITYLLIPILSVYLFICNLSIISFADVPSNQIVQGISGTWTYNHSYGGLGKYFTISDATGLDTCSSLAPYFYYTSDNVTFKKLSGINTIAFVLNKVVGIVISPTELQTFYNKFFTALNVTDDNGHLQNGLYDSSDNFYGYALNDISGCYYNGLGSGNVNIPSYVSNNVKIVVDNELDLSPPYIHYYPFSSNNILNSYQYVNLLNTTDIENFYNFLNSNGLVARCQFNINTGKFDFSTGGRYLITANDIKYVISKSDTYFNNFCTANILTIKDYDLSFGEIVRDSFIPVALYDSSKNIITSGSKYGFSDNSTTSVNLDFQNGTGNYFYIGYSGTSLYSPFNDDFIIYKNLATVISLDNKTYRPSVYTTTNYVNYNPSNDNSITTSVSNIDNSITNNETIYNNVDNSYSEYIDNSVIDNSSVVNNTTNIVNNYYGTSSGDDSGGDSDSDGVLDTLLQGLLAFFNAIGRVLATVITGILDMFTTVLDAISNLTTDLTGITDFFGTLFSWMPDPIPQVIGIGFSICVLAAVIKFIRG